MTMLSKYYRVGLELRPLRGEQMQPGVLQVILRDLMRISVAEHGETRIAADMPVPDIDLTVQEFIAELTGDNGLSYANGLAFGRFLRRRLLLESSQGIAELWRNIELQLQDREQCLHLQVVLPGSAESRGADLPLAELPLELLADEHGFLFRQPGYVLVRTFPGLRKHSPQIASGARAAVIWANPPVIMGDSSQPAPLDAQIFEEHETLLEKAATALKLTVVEPCRRATRERIDEFLGDSEPVPLLSVVVHGVPEGGAVLLHEPSDENQAAPVLAEDFAQILSVGQPDIVLLWTCYGARRHPDYGSIAEALLQLRLGGAAVVVASHASLQARDTVKVAQGLFRELGGASQGDLERALSRSLQKAMMASNLRWSAPVYYARPDDARPATLAADDERATHAPPLTSERVRLAHAPGLTPYFRGRDAEVATGMRLLGEHRLVSVHGMPGIGKTELCLAIANQLLDQGAFARGVWRLLAGVTTVDELAALLADDAGTKESTAIAVARGIGNAAWLVVLDNAEDLMEADRLGLQEYLDALLRECPGLRFLLSTRRRLGDLQAAREAALRVDRLEPPSDLELFRAIVGERLAPAVLARDEVRGLVALLEGHPQSSVLVAGQVGVLSIQAIRRRLERHGADAAVIAHELIGMDEEADADDIRLRSKRLISSLNLSYRPLAERQPAAAEMFAWLGILPAGLPAVLLERVFGERAEELLAVLFQYNLVEQRGPDRRLGMPAPLRWYAARRLDEFDAARQRELLAVTTRAMYEWVEVMFAQARTNEALRGKERALIEHSNLAALLARAAVPASRGLALLWARLMFNWSQIMQFAGHTAAAIPLVEQARAIQSPGSEGEAHTLLVLGELYARRHRLNEAKRNCETALAVYRALSAHLPTALDMLRGLEVHTGRSTKAEQSSEVMLQVQSALRARLGEANTLRALGELHARMAKLNEAIQSYEEARTLYRELKEPLGEANTLQALGELYVWMDELKEAEQCYKAALPVFQKFGDPLGEANTLRKMGVLYERMHRWEEAEASHKDALRMYRQVEDRLGEANTLQELGDLYVDMERLEEAEQCYKAALLAQLPQLEAKNNFFWGVYEG